MKDGPYLTHDLGARNDPKLVAAERESRGLFKAIWWDLCEMLWENGGYLPLDYEQLAYILRYPTPAELERTITGFDLFQNDGTRFWNDSALERIEHKNDVKERKAEGGRRSGETRSARRPSEDSSNNVPNTPRSIFEDSSEDSSNNAPNNKSMNKEIKKSLSPGAPARARESRDDEEERERIFEIFFFRNFADPVGEVERFCEFYNPGGTGWKNSNGRRITNIQRAAEEWRPEKSGNRFSAKWLEWFKAVYAAAKSDGDGIDNMLSTIRGVYSQGPARFFVDCADRRVAETIGNFVKENDLERGLEVRFGTKS